MYFYIIVLLLSLSKDLNAISYAVVAGFVDRAADRLGSELHIPDKNILTVVLHTHS